MAVGAAGCLINQTSAHFLVPEAIRGVQEGIPFFRPSLAKQHREHYEESPDQAGLVKKKGDA